jgi:hypothetical protein
MKTFVCTLVFALFTISVSAGPPTVTLVSHLQDANIQIITSATLTLKAYYFVLQSTTDFTTWSVMGTNALSYNPTTGLLMGTNSIQITNSMTFFRILVIPT